MGQENRQEMRVLSSFSGDNYDAGTLADFGWRIARINQPRDFVTEQIDGNYYDGYSLEFINSLLDLYLGIVVVADEIPGSEYRIVRDGIVYMPSGDSASYWDLAIASDVSLLGDDTLLVNFDVYEVYDQDIAPVGETIQDERVYYTTAQEGQDRDTFIWKYSGSAVIGFDGALSDRDNFTLREYTLDGATNQDESDAAPADEAPYKDENAAAPSTSSGVTANNLFSQIPSKYTMSSIGGWQTEITLESDGSFSGIYSSTDPGDSGPGYDITRYYSEFSGKFVNPRQIDDYTWSFELGELTYATPVGETQTGPDSEFPGYTSKVIYVDAYGIEGGKTFYLYMPGAPTADLPAGFIDWAYSIADGAELTGYGIYNVDGQYGFVGWNDDWN